MVIHGRFLWIVVQPLMDAEMARIRKEVKQTPHDPM